MGNVLKHGPVVNDQADQREENQRCTGERAHVEVSEEAYKSEYHTKNSAGASRNFTLMNNNNNNKKTPRINQSHSGGYILTPATTQTSSRAFKHPDT